MWKWPKAQLLAALVAAVLSIIAINSSSYAADLYGQVLRKPAKISPERAISRYRGRENLVKFDTGEDCVCNPGLFSVIILTGQNLPQANIPDSVPIMAQKDKMFVPSVLTVSVGATVEFPNLDQFFHNVFSYSSAKQFDLGRYPQGKSEAVTFDKPGIVKVFCEIHYSMRAYVHVLESPYFATSDERGNFVIKDVIPGTYTVNVWQENLPEITQTIIIKNDSTYLKIGQ